MRLADTVFAHDYVKAGANVHSVFGSVVKFWTSSVWIIFYPIKYATGTGGLAGRKAQIGARSTCDSSVFTANSVPRTSGMPKLFRRSVCMAR